LKKETAERNVETFEENNV